MDPSSNHPKPHSFQFIFIMWRFLFHQYYCFLSSGLNGSEGVIEVRNVRILNYISSSSLIIFGVFSAFFFFIGLHLAAAISLVYSVINLSAFLLTARRHFFMGYLVLCLGNLSYYDSLAIMHGRSSGAYLLVVLWIISAAVLYRKSGVHLLGFLSGIVSYVGLELYSLHHSPFVADNPNYHYIYLVVFFLCLMYILFLIVFFKNIDRVYQDSLQRKNEELQKYFTAIEQTHATVVITDVDGNIEYVNPQFEKISGYSFQEVKGKNPRILKSDKTSAEKYKNLWETITAGKVWHGEFVNLTKNKEEYNELAIISPILNANNEIISFIAVKDNSTEIKKIEQALKESELKYRLLAENSSDVIWTVDVNAMRLDYMSPSVEKLTGYTVDEIISEPFERLVNSESLKKIMILRKQAFQAWGQQSTFEGVDEFRMFCKDGRMVDTEVSYNVLFDCEGNPTKVIGVSRDITQRKIAERILKESEEKYRLIAENTSDVIWKIDLATFRFSYVSPSVEFARGYTVEEFLSLPVEGIIANDVIVRNAEDAYHYIEKVGENPNFCSNRRYKLPHKDGRLIDVEVSLTFIRDNQGKPVEILGVSRDISERVKVEGELEKSREQLAQLLARQTERNLRLTTQLDYIYNHAVIAIAFFKIEGTAITFYSCNDLWANGLGLSSDDLEGKDISRVCDEKTQVLYRAYILKALEVNEAIEDYVYWKDRYLYVMIVPITDSITQEKYCASFIYNFTEKRQVELKMLESEEKFRNIFNNSKDAIVLLNFYFQVIEGNEEFYRILGLDQEKSVNLKQFISPKCQNDASRRIGELRDGLPVSSYECELIRTGGTLVPIEVSSSVVTINENRFVLSIIRDITIRKNFERSITQTGIQIETRERRKLAADLHDNVGPLLSSLNMCFSLLCRKPGVKEYPNDIADIRHILKDSIAAVREISNNISPQVLANYGLTSALEMFFDTKSKLINIAFNNNIGELRFAEIKEVMIYYIIREAFNNTLKYAKATTVEVNIDKADNFIVVLYKDNGIGFDLEEKLASSGTHLGLQSIINRVKNLEGKYRIETSPGNGFLLEVIF